MAELERQRRDIEAKIADEEEKTKDRRMRMQRIRNEKELAALRREVDLSKELSMQLEESLLRLLDGGDSKVAELKTLEEELTLAEQRLAARAREPPERSHPLAARH